MSLCSDGVNNGVNNSVNEPNNTMVNIGVKG